MRTQRLLYLGTHQMTAYRWRRGALAREAAFPPTAVGWGQFARYLAQNAKSRFSLLADVAEEGFQLETIPYLRGADRQRVIERKLAQTFFDTPLRAAISLGHEKNRRKDERLLLAALGNPAFFQPWLDGVRATDTALCGIFSLPLITPLLLKKLRIPPHPCLLLSVQEQSLRQSFFDQGELRFSRLTALQQSGVGGVGGVGGIGGIAQAFATESAKLQQYLASQRLIGRGQAVTAHILAHPGAFEAIQDSCADTPALAFKLLDIGECARRVGLKTAPQDSRAEPLFLHLLAADPPGAQFAGEDLRHVFHIAQLRSLLRGAGVLALGACLLLSGKYLFDAHRVARDLDTLRGEAALARRQYGEILGSFPSVPVDDETLKRVIDHYLAEEKRGATPAAFYREISQALEAEAAIEIDRLEWKIGGGEPGAAGGDGMAADARPPPEDGESMAVHGRLRLPAQASTRQWLAAFNRFVDALRAAGLRVEILQQPFDIASGASLRGGDASAEEEKPREFALRVSREAAP
ncbi:MAG: hypothetical protein LBS49_01475 [Candidatus Accumulibacter sp.]|jgi:hypothetical protein|nr:hypothetical protein [Accumulibacter sp.]